MNLRRIWIVFSVVVRDFQHYKACHVGRKLVSKVLLWVAAPLSIRTFPFLTQPFGARNRALAKGRIPFRSKVNVVIISSAYGCVLWGNNYEAAIFQVVKLQNKAVTIINEVPLREHITPDYVNLIKFPDIVKSKTCELFYDLIVANKPSNL